MDEPIFSGVGVALATFFDEDGEIDARATADHASTLVELGLRAVVVAGSTGEAASRLHPGRARPRGRRRADPLPSRPARPPALLRGGGGGGQRPAGARLPLPAGVAAGPAGRGPR